MSWLGMPKKASAAAPTEREACSRSRLDMAEPVRAGHRQQEPPGRRETRRVEHHQGEDEEEEGERPADDARAAGCRSCPRHG